MNCKEVQNKLNFFLDRQLDGQEANLVQEHFNSCPICLEILEKERKEDVAAGYQEAIVKTLLKGVKECAVGKTGALVVSGGVSSNSASSFSTWSNRKSR
mgnify:CR=1 FL=1